MKKLIERVLKGIARAATEEVIKGALGTIKGAT